MDITTRRLLPADWKQWKQIRLESLRLHPESFGSSIEEEESLSAQDFQKRIENNAIFGAYDGDNLIGTVGFFALKNMKSRHRGTMFGMYIRKEWRKNGAGDKLVETVINHARSLVLQIHCTVITENIAATKLYERHGFKIYGTEPRALKVDDAYHDEYCMALFLAE